MNKLNKMILPFVVLAMAALFVVLVLSPSQSVSATEDFQDPNIETCMGCHAKVADLWKGSHHNTGNVSCVVCHKLANNSGKHPEDTKFTVESEETTCLVCHAEVAGENIAGQLAISQHGQVGLTCVSCHEQHSQGLKLSYGSQTVCENCHKKEMESVLKSTHFKAGLSCVNCHMGEDKNHTLIVAVQTCGDCHTDLHEASRMLDAGLEVEVVTTPAAMVEVTPIPTIEDNGPVSGGVKMPSWTLVFAGMLIGAVISWALVGKDPGKPSDKK